VFQHIAGFISVLLFQQGAVAILHAVGFTPATPFPNSAQEVAMIAPAVVIGGAGEDRAELLRVERMLRTFAATEK
jgi:hypothetical protein